MLFGIMDSLNKSQKIIVFWNLIIFPILIMFFIRIFYGTTYFNQVVAILCVAILCFTFILFKTAYTKFGCGLDLLLYTIATLVLGVIFIIYDNYSYYDSSKDDFIYRTFDILRIKESYEYFIWIFGSYLFLSVYVLSFSVIVEMIFAQSKYNSDDQKEFYERRKNLFRKPIFDRRDSMDLYIICFICSIGGIVLTFIYLYLLTISYIAI